MVEGIALLLLAQLAGECLHDILGLPVPGPVIGMFLVAVGMIVRARLRPSTADAITSLDRVSNALIGNMGLLFVPAGVGIIAVAPMLGGAWLPLGVALVASTILTLIVTALVMHAFARAARAPAADDLEP